MRIKNLFVAWLLVSLICNGQQFTYEKFLGTNNLDFLYSSRILSDSTIILAGTTHYDISSGYVKPYFIKTDSYGSILWTKILGHSTSGFDQIISVSETHDNGIVACGRTSCFGAGNYDINLYKLSQNGDLQWAKAIGSQTGDELGAQVIQTYDKGLIIVGTSTYFSSGWKDIYVIKTDSFGNILWTKTIGTPFDDDAYSVFECYNKDLVIAGSTKETSPGNKMEAIIIRMDKNGIIKWVNKYGGPNDDNAHAIVETKNKELVITGSYNYNSFLLKTDSLGNTIWSKSYNYRAFDWGNSLKITKDDKILVCGHQFPNEQLSDILIMKLGQSGDLIWAKNLGDDKSQYGINVDEFSNGTVLLTGYWERTQSEGLHDFSMAKLDSVGRLVCSNRESALTFTALSLVANPKICTITNGGGILTNITNSKFSIGSSSLICDGTVETSTVSLNENSKMNDLKVFPNPCSGTFNILISNFDNADIFIKDAIGRIVFEKSMQRGKNVIITALEPGLYTYSIAFEKRSVGNGKLIIN